MVADSASQLAPACRLADAIAEGIADDAEYCPVHVVIPKSAAIPSQRQIRELSLPKPPSVRSFQDLIRDPETLEYDVVVAMLPGTSLFKLRLGIERLFEKTGASRRPLLVTGYNGLVCTGAQEGLLWRLGYDLICVNSNRDYRLFKRMCLDVGMSPASLFVVGVLMTANGVYTPPPAEAEIRNLVFALRKLPPQATGDSQAENRPRGANFSPRELCLPSALGPANSVEHNSLESSFSLRSAMRLPDALRPAGFCELDCCP